MSADDINRVVVIGAGIMGAGIAQNFAQAGLEVHLVDIDTSTLERCRKQIAFNLKAFKDFEFLSEDIATIQNRIKFFMNSDLASAISGCHFVVEAMPEVLDFKRNLFLQLDDLPNHVILATNTSSMTVSQIAEGMTSPERVVGLHYFNPAHIIPTVEIHQGSATTEKAIEATRTLMLKTDKLPVLVRKEIPGFIINRLTGAMEREIDYLLDEGVVSPEDLDNAVKGSFGFRLACLGPMEAEDKIGLDTAARASANIFPTLSNATGPSPNLLAKVDQGELGIKSGSGWFNYPESDQEKLMADHNTRLLHQLKVFQSR